MKIKNITPTEYEEQIALVEYLSFKNLKFSSIPNSTFTISWKQKIKNKKMGLNAGLPDIIVILPKLLLFIELKRITGGVLSEYQKSWIEELNKIKGVKAIVSKGANEAINFIENYLKNI